MGAVTDCVSAADRVDLADGALQGPDVGSTAIHAVDPLANEILVCQLTVEADVDRRRERLTDTGSALRRSRRRGPWPPPSANTAAGSRPPSAGESSRGVRGPIGASGPFVERRSERLSPAAAVPTVMSGSDGGGLMSSAGLVRYFDAEDRNAIRIDPRTIVAFGVLFGGLILLLNAFA